MFLSKVAFWLFMRHAIFVVSIVLFMPKFITNSCFHSSRPITDCQQAYLFSRVLCVIFTALVVGHSTVNCQPSTFTAFQPQITM